MFVTPRSVRSRRVLVIETTLTSAMGMTPTTSSATRTFCQNFTSPSRYNSVPLRIAPFFPYM